MVEIPGTLADSFSAGSGSRNTGAGQSSVVYGDGAARKDVSIPAHLSYTTLDTSRLPRANISPGAGVHWNPRLSNAGHRHHRMWPLLEGDHSDLEHWVRERVRSVMMSIQILSYLLTSRPGLGILPSGFGHSSHCGLYYWRCSVSVVVQFSPS